MKNIVKSLIKVLLLTIGVCLSIKGNTENVSVYRMLGGACLGLFVMIDVIFNKGFDE